MLPALIIAVAASTPAPMPATTYRTTLVRRFDSLGSNGTMKLWFASSGYVRGTYVADDGGSAPMTVSGGRDGTKIWLDIPALGLHVEGTIENGVIHALGSTSRDNHAYVFSATPP